MSCQDGNIHDFGERVKANINFQSSLLGSAESNRQTPEGDNFNQDDVDVNYSNVLPSKVRYGNKQVMPLLP